MNAIQAIPFYFLIIVLTGLVVFLNINNLRQSEKRIHDLIDQVERLLQERDQLKVELENLIERKRQTGPTVAGIEDAMAAIINVQVNRDVEQVRLDAALNYLQQIRQGPYAYKPDRAAGPREEYK
jgi:regulator of replication initiation timing